MCPHCPPDNRTVGVRIQYTFTCSNPDHAYTTDADFVGMMNLYRKWNGTFTYPAKKTKDELKPAQTMA